MDRLLPVNEVAVRLGVSVRGIWRQVANGDLPQPVKLGKSSRWFESDLEAAFERLKRQRGRMAVN